MKNIKTILVALGAFSLVACASTKPSSELQTARDAYSQAKQSQTAQVSPVELREAQRTLARAEEAYQDSPGSPREVHLAYVALRQVEKANATAAASVARTEQERAQSTYETELEREAEAKRAFADNLRDAQAQLEQVRSQMKQQGAQMSAALQEKERQLAEHVAKLEQAEQRAAKARQMLEEMANVREEKQRLEITLSGSVLFKTDSAELLPMAQQRLDAVADALEGYESPSIVIEGHTDSRGTEKYNQELSKNRAESVKRYLVSRGLPAADVRAIGKGEAEPIAKNDSPEGRANNRRVEIIVDHSGKSNQQAAVSAR